MSEIGEYLVALSWYHGREDTGLAGVSGITGASGTSDPLKDVSYNILLAGLGGVDGKLVSEYRTCKRSWCRIEHKMSAH